MHDCHDQHPCISALGPSSLAGICYYDALTHGTDDATLYVQLQSSSSSRRRCCQAEAKAAIPSQAAAKANRQHLRASLLQMMGMNGYSLMKPSTAAMLLGSTQVEHSPPAPQGQHKPRLRLSQPGPPLQLLPASQMQAGMPALRPQQHLPLHHGFRTSCRTMPLLPLLQWPQQQLQPATQPTTACSTNSMHMQRVEGQGLRRACHAHHLRHTARARPTSQEAAHHSRRGLQRSPCMAVAVAARQQASTRQMLGQQLRGISSSPTSSLGHLLLQRASKRQAGASERHGCLSLMTHQQKAFTAMTSMLQQAAHQEHSGTQALQMTSACLPGSVVLLHMRLRCQQLFKPLHRSLSTQRMPGHLPCSLASTRWQASSTSSISSTTTQPQPPLVG
jgi:hypothetical protein